jgi:hypothetical protein
LIERYFDAVVAVDCFKQISAHHGPEDGAQISQGEFRDRLLKEGSFVV